jgi:uroporphyrinogen decarboxylase
MNEHMYKLDREISSAEDWRKLRRQKFEDTPYVDFIEEFKAIRREIPSETPLFATIHGVFVSGYHATEGSGNFSNPNNRVTSHMREDPESVSVGLRTIAETLVDLVLHLKRAGADGIYYAALGGERYRLTQDILERYVIPLDSFVIDAIHDAGLLSILHICKDKVRLPSYGAINTDIVNWAVHECEYSLAEGRNIFPGKTLLGGFDDRSGILVEGTAEQITAEAGKILSEAGRERFIFGADCTLPDDIAPWRIKAVHDFAAKM